LAQAVWHWWVKPSNEGEEHMNAQPEALRLADWLDGSSNGPMDAKHKAAAELRRLHQSEREGWRYADELDQERKRLHEENKLLEASNASLREQNTALDAELAATERQVNILTDALAESRKQRRWQGLEQEDMPDGDDPMLDHDFFIKGMVWADAKLKEKNT
jgi:chromosome segregation ATPase